jgi:prepilin-type N-terminal cleavage/methylation domain-containing protein
MVAVRRRLRDSRGFTLVELLVAMAIISILAVIAVQLFESLAARSRLTRAAIDAKTISSAVSLYTAHMGTLPSSLNELTIPAVNTAGHTAGPFLELVPTPPSAAWTPYTLTPTANGTFTITTNGEGQTVTKP